MGGLTETDRQEEGEKQGREEKARDTRQEMGSELRLAAAVKEHTCRTADGGKALATGGRGRSLLWQPTPTAVTGCLCWDLFLFLNCVSWCVVYFYTFIGV